MFFSLPWMLLGLLGLPALAAIYWLRSRAKPRTVSSLFLWIDQRRPRQGGRVFQRLQTPLTFFLELLAIAAIVMAAAGPALTQSRSARPIILVLDDSYSMQAGEKTSPRQQASQKLLNEFRRTSYLARVILAGPQPQLLGGTVRTADQLQETLEQWTCVAPTAGLETAITLAGEIGGATARVLVVSDHPPDSELPAGKVEWWSFGQPRANFAFTAASRDPADGGIDRVLLEITHFGTAPGATDLILAGADLDAPRRQRLELEPGTASRLILNVPSNSAPLRVTLSQDELSIDNEVVLVSTRRRQLRVQLSLHEAAPASANLRTALVRALQASGQALMVESRADLVITDREQPPPVNGSQLEILAGPEPESYEGPFVFDRSHPLTEGLSLDAVIWSVPKETIPVGSPIVLAGNRVLIADREETSGRHRIQMVLSPALSNLTETPDWPIFVTNLIRWCLTEIPGPAQSNLRLGQTFRATLSEEAASSEKAVVMFPDQKERSFPIHGRQFELPLDRIGLYQARAGEMSFPFTCNTLNADESNLSACAKGEWGSWNDSPEFQDQRINLGWAFILIALGCLMTQMAIVSRSGGSGT